MDLELEMDAAFGSISRIESNKTNPTRDTVLRLSQVLKLNERELDYLIGFSAVPATISEVQYACQEVAGLFSKPGVIAYLIDDRFRLCAMSDTFRKWLKIDGKTFEQVMFLKNYIALLLEPEYGLSHYIAGTGVYFNLKLLLLRFKYQMGFMFDDVSFAEAIDAIEENPMAKAVWEHISTGSGTLKSAYISNQERKTHFNINGQKVSLQYATEPLQKYRRFDVVEYFPKSNIIKDIKGIT